MRTSASTIGEMREAGLLWEPVPGLASLRGPAAQLRTAIEHELYALCLDAAEEEWHVPPAVPFATLARADYFASFPQWLTAVAHLDSDEATLESIAQSVDPALSAVGALRPSAVALQPAVCYHVYSALADSVLRAPACCTISGTCWRHETDRFVPLERGWAFTMREVVHVGSAEAVGEFRMRGIDAAVRFARRLGLDASIETAVDPFFAPSTRGRAVLQHLRSLKHELRLPIGGGRSVAAASFNDHAQFFGEAFAIQLENGTPATSGCVAFGVERWVLAILVQYGLDPDDWPLSLHTPAVHAAGDAGAAGRW